MAGVPADPDDNAYLAALVRQVDRPRYYANLFAARIERADLFALHGFAAEIERIPDHISDPTLGQIRLQWWRDSLSAAAGGEGQGDSPALRAVASLIERHALPLPPFLALIDARGADLYSDPPPTLADLEELIGKTQSSLFQLGAVVSEAAGGEMTEAARHGGLAYGLARNIARFAFDRARGRAFLPADLLAMEELNAADVFAAEPAAGLHRVVAAVGNLARHHLRAARELLASAPGRTVVFLPLAIVEPLLARIEQLDAEILQRPASLSDLETLLRIGWARLRSRSES